MSQRRKMLVKLAITVSLAPLFSEEVRRDPYRYYAELHRRAPVCLVEPDDSRYDILVVGHDACSRVLKDPIFKVVDDTLVSRKPSWEHDRTHAVFMNSLMFTNAPRQTRMRKLFNHAFTPRHVEALEPAIAEIGTRLLDRMAQRLTGGQSLDFMSEYAFPLPAAVLGRLLGVPDEDLSWYRERAAELGKVIELGGGTPENVRRANAASVELTDYFAGLVAQRRSDPRADMITELVRAQQRTDSPLTDRELLSNLVIVFNAGFVTTVHLLGNGLTLLLDHPDALAELRAHPELAPGYVDEILRLEGPTHFVVRVCAEDTELDGVEVAKGSRLLVLLAAANRDPARFPDPDRFDPTRPERTHLAFSTGPHYCLGSALARLEGQRGLTMFLQRFPRVELAHRPAPPRQLMLRGHDTLWITVPPAGT